MLKGTFILQNNWDQHSDLLTPAGRKQGRPSVFDNYGTYEGKMVDLGKIPFLKRNRDSTSGCGFLGDGLDYVCGIITGLSLL